MKRVDKTLYPVQAGAWSGGRIRLILKRGGILKHVGASFPAFRHTFTDEIEDSYNGVVNTIWHDLTFHPFARIVTDTLIRATPRRKTMNERLKASEEDYLASIRVEKAAYNRLLTAQAELVKAVALHQRAREGCIDRLRKLNDAMNAARNEGV